MTSILKEIDKVRDKLKYGQTNKLLLQKPFAQGMYLFSMFMIGYYQRVRTRLNFDYDSFIIIQVVVSHTLYYLSKVKENSSYEDLEAEWGKLTKIYQSPEADTSDSEIINSHKLTISSICLVSALPKETVRRKANELCKKNVLKNSKKNGIQLGAQYKKIFQSFVPETTKDVAKLIKRWKKSGILDTLLSFE